MYKSVLITGANGGLGKESARQLAQNAEVNRIILACRSESKANEAKQELEKETGRSIFEIALMDFSDADSVRQGVKSIKGSVDALILNAGGMGGKDPGAKSKSGMNMIAAANIIGHAALIEALVEQGAQIKRVVYVSSEAARGVPSVGMKKPELKSFSVDEFKSILEGGFFGSKLDPGQAYGYVKLVGTLWTSALSRKFPEIEFVSVSPGATKGTAVADNAPPLIKFMFKYVMYPIILPLKGMVHGVEKGAARYVQALQDPTLKSGKFYASKEGKLTGELVEQSPFFPALAEPTFQENAYQAVQSYL